MLFVPFSVHIFLSAKKSVTYANAFVRINSVVDLIQHGSSCTTTNNRNQSLHPNMKFNKIPNLHKVQMNRWYLYCFSYSSIHGAVEFVGDAEDNHVPPMS